MNKRIKDINRFIFGIAIIVFVNVLAFFAFTRFDLTEDQRYSVSETTASMLKQLDDKVYIKVYLYGNYPAGFKNLERGVREKLEEFKTYGGSNFKFQFIDPSAISDKKRRNELYQEIVGYGIQPTTLHATEEGKKVEKLVFPGAVVTYKSKVTAINFFKGNKLSAPEVRINQAIEGLEFEFASAVRRLTKGAKKKIAFIDGHGELSDIQLNDIMSTLSENYLVGRLNISTLPSIEQDIAALVIAQPKKAFTDADKFKLDQYVMNGGKVLFFLDALEARQDSAILRALPIELNLNDLLFKYGIRINQNMIQDLYAAPVPVNTGSEMKLMPWSFFPLLNRYSDHPIVRNMDAIVARYLGSVDTVKAPGILKTPLVFTSQYTKVKGQPVAYSADELRIELEKEYYNSGSLPISYLLEGKFGSLYKNRPAPLGAPDKNRVNESKETKILVFSDGDVIANEIDPKSGKPFQLGFDKFTRQVYSNKEFVKNAIDYMLDETGVVNLRSKVVKLRPLDKFKVQEEKTIWQFINLLAPILILVAFGLTYHLYRKRKYTRF